MTKWSKQKLVLAESQFWISSQRLAVDISLGALLGEQVYSFGQLLQHPIVHVLDGAEYGWLHELLQAFNQGAMHGYDALCIKHVTQLN
eukprot:gene3283-13310_t